MYLVAVCHIAGQKEQKETIRDFMPRFPVKMNQYLTYHDENGITISVDQRATFNTGYMMSEMCTMSAYDFVHPEDLRCVLAAHCLCEYPLF